METKLDLKHVLSREIMKLAFPEGHSEHLKFIPCAMTRFVSASFSKENLKTKLDQLGCDMVTDDEKYFEANAVGSFGSIYENFIKNFELEGYTED